MNYAGTFEFSHFGDDAQAEGGAGPNVVAHEHMHGVTPTVVVQDANLLFSGDYKRAGVDLVLSKDGHEHVVADYFKGAQRATLSSPDGATLSPDLVKALVGEVQMAQAAGGGAGATAQVIGSVTKLTGSATAIRNGVSIMLNVGDAVQKGDVVQAGADSSLGLTFIDGTVFGLSANARMVLNEMVYDPNGSSNSSLLSLVQGTITFVAGETAKHGDMRVDTPVATMGIRGTAVLVEIGFEVPGQGGAPPVKFQVLVEPGGHVGSYFLYSKTTGQIIGTVNQSGQVTSVTGSGDVAQNTADPLSPIAQGIIQQTLQQYFPNYVPNANPRSTGPGSGSTPADPNSGTSPDPLKFNSVPDPGVGQPFVVPINLPGDGPGTPPINVTITRFNSAPTITVSPVVVTLPVDKTSFDIKDQVVITDPDSGDTATPYVPGTAYIISVSGPANTPASLDLKSLVTVDPVTGHVSYNPAAFKFLGAGQKAVYTIGFDSQSGPDTVAKTLTFTVDGVNDAPVVSAPLASTAQQGAAPHSLDLLAGASDPDAGETATLTIANVKYAVNGGTASTTAPVGLTLNGASLQINPEDPSFVSLAVGQTKTIVVSYDIVDAEGAVVHQTETITVTGVNDAPVVTMALSRVATQGDAAQTINLLAGASDPDAGETATLTIANVKYAVDGDNASATAPVGLTLNGTNLQFNPDDPSFASLAAGQTKTIVVSYDIVDAQGAVVHQTETIAITGINDAPVVSGPVHGAATEDAAQPVTLNALAHASDIDNGATLSVVDVPATLPAGVSYDAATHSFSLDPAASAYQSLAAGEHLVVTVTYAVSDGLTTTPASVSWTVTGTNDAAVISGATTGGVTVGSEVTTTSGILTDTDVDGVANTFQAVSSATATDQGYGRFTIDASGNWTFYLDTTNAAVAGLGLDETLTDTFTVKAADGTAQQITITISGPPYTGTSTWIGPMNGNWSDAANWSPARVPGPNDSAVFIAPVSTLLLTTAIIVGSLEVADGALLNFTGEGSLDISELTNNGTIVIAPNTTVEVNGVVQNSGQLTVDNHAAGATLLIHHTVTFEGGGTVTLDGTADRITGDSHTSKLVNLDNTIDGYGKLGDGHLSIVNEKSGSIVASDRWHALIIDTGHDSLTNFGSIASEAAGGLEIKGDLTNDGTLLATDGLLKIDGDIWGTGSATLAGGDMEFGGRANIHVTFATASHDELVLDRGSHFTGTVSGLSSGDSIDLEGIAPWQLRFYQHDGVVDVYYGWGSNDHFTLTDPGVLKHLDISSDRSGTEITWTNDAPEIDTSDVHLSKTGNDTYKISGLSVSDGDWNPGDSYTLDITGHGSDVDMLSAINRDLDRGFTFTKTPGSPPQATVAVDVTDQYGASDHVNFIFSTASGTAPVTLTGTNDKDVIFATGGKDTLTGKGGADQFVFAAHSGVTAVQDTITDFKPGEDKIELDNFRSVPNLSGPLSELQLYLWKLTGGIEQSHGDTLIHLDGHDTLRLTGVSVSQLHASDFIVHPYSSTA